MPKPPKRQTLLTVEEVIDLHNALDVLCGCYADGTDSPFVQELLERYAPGTPEGKRARALFTHLQKLASIRIEQISPQNNNLSAIS